MGTSTYNSYVFASCDRCCLSVIRYGIISGAIRLQTPSLVESRLGSTIPEAASKDGLRNFRSGIEASGSAVLELIHELGALAAFLHLPKLPS